MSSKKASSSFSGFDFSGIRRILLFLLFGGICYFVYQTFVAQTSQLTQQIKLNNEKPVETPKALNGYGTLIKNEVKKIPSPSPQ